MSEWTTDVFTVGPVSAGATLIFAHAIGGNRCIIGKTKCVPASGSGTFDMGIYKHNTCLAADVVLSWQAVPTSPGLFDPIENAGAGPVERNQGEAIYYEDLEAAGNINGSITNHDAGSRSFTVSISYLKPDPLPYDIIFSLTGIAADTFTYPVMTFTRSVNFAANFAGSSGSVGTNPTSTATFTIKKNGSSVGTIVVSTGGVVTFTSSGAVSFVSGDRMTLVSPALDPTLANVAFTISGLEPIS